MAHGRCAAIGTVAVLLSWGLANFNILPISWKNPLTVAGFWVLLVGALRTCCILVQHTSRRSRRRRKRRSGRPSRQQLQHMQAQQRQSAAAAPLALDNSSTNVSSTNILAVFHLGDLLPIYSMPQVPERH